MIPKIKHNSNVKIKSPLPNETYDRIFNCKQQVPILIYVDQNLLAFLQDLCIPFFFLEGGGGVIRLTKSACLYEIHKYSLSVVQQCVSDAARKSRTRWRA